MRFSLLSLILVTLWIALALLVWMWREPWILQSRNEYPSISPYPFAFEEYIGAGFYSSPDGTRKLSTLLPPPRNLGADRIDAYPLHALRALSARQKGSNKI